MDRSQIHKTDNIIHCTKQSQVERNIIFITGPADKNAPGAAENMDFIGQKNFSNKTPYSPHCLCFLLYAPLLSVKVQKKHNTLPKLSTINDYYVEVTLKEFFDNKKQASIFLRNAQGEEVKRRLRSQKTEESK
ncbi:MAG: hypothetical protein M0R74_15415 [Dehalococcoidia bacterium]|nr:hypothetical protein [Dehalococcoidia bacterium]